METGQSKEQLEKEKLSNEIKLQEIEINHRKKPKGRLFHFIEPAKEWGQTFATVFLGIIGIYFTFSTNSNQEKNSKIMMATSLMSNREKSETDFRQSMFKPLIEQILDDTLSLKKRMAVFELFENNFNDLFNSRSIYDVLWEAAEKNNNRELKTNLIKLARYTTAKQELEINQMEYRKSLCTTGGANTITYTFLDEDRNEAVKIQLDSILEHDVLIRVNITCNWDNSVRTIKVNNGKSIHLSYFDTPLSNNFILPDGDRIAIILEGIVKGHHKPDSARLDIVHFPADFVTTGYRPSINKVNELISSKE